MTAQLLFEDNLRTLNVQKTVLKSPPKKKPEKVYPKFGTTLRKRRVYCRSVRGVVPENFEWVFRMEGMNT